jgi:hypothetical protein
MPPPDRRHLYHLSIYELHPVIFVKDPGLAHLSIFLGGEAMPYGARSKSPSKRLTLLTDILRYAAPAGTVRYQMADDAVDPGSASRVAPRSGR